MAAQPQQPIYPNELKYELDRQFNRMTAYEDAQRDAIMSQMRVGFAESLARDDALLKRIENIESNQKVVIDMQRDMLTTMQTMRQEMQTMRQEMQDRFTEQAERHNELMVRVSKIEQKLNKEE